MKKGYLRTLEAVLAIVITFIFLIFIIPNNFSGSKQEKLNILNNLIEENEFRDAIMNMSSECLNKTSGNQANDIINPIMGDEWNYYLCKDKKPEELPRKEVFVESAFFTGNITDYYPNKIIKLYYWHN